MTDMPKGQFCKITANIDPTIGFEVGLLMDHWAQRYAQGGCGAYCGDAHVGSNHTGSCMPALNGEFTVASDDLGHSGFAHALHRSPYLAVWNRFCARSTSAYRQNANSWI